LGIKSGVANLQKLLPQVLSSQIIPGREREIEDIRKFNNLQAFYHNLHFYYIISLLKINKKLTKLPAVY
jgi:hypothetical protein